MLKKFLKILCVIGLLTSSAVHADVTVDKAAPDFTLPTATGENFTLSEQKGKVVVLEWFNHQCPFVRKHYDSKNMQGLQEKYTGKGVVWVLINSSAPDKQGHLTAEKAREVMREEGSHATALLLDPAGEVGKLYGAKTTPHMFIVDGEGMLRYAGAIDSIASADKGDIVNAESYVSSALDSMLEGKKVTAKVTQPYGCSVKY